MNKPLISVIVPVYKAEAYLTRCVESIRNQSYQNLEIILVDDGSPDNCGNMCDSFALEDSRIRVIHKENGGQSTARNAALDIASGDYFGFVDSDDWIDPDMFQTLYVLLEKHHAQIAACGILIEYSDGSSISFNPEYPQNQQVQVYDTIEALRQVTKNQKITNSLCDKLFCREIFAGIRMTPGKIYEDMEIIPQCVEKAQRVVYDPAPKVHYNQTQESTIRGEYNPARFAEADIALAKVLDYKDRYPQLYADAMANYISICLNCIYLSRKNPTCDPRRKALIQQMRYGLKSEDTGCLSRNGKIKLFSLRLAVPIFYLLMALKG